MATAKILLAGATGYIGGSVLAQLLESKFDLAKYPISVLVRGEDKAKDLRSKGFHPILFNSLDEIDVLEKAATEHDVVIHTASGFHTASAVAFITGLADRKNTSAKSVHYIHTSGTSDIADHPMTGAYHETRILSDRSNLYPYLKAREALQVYPQRTTDIAVIEKGLALGVKTTIIMPPTIYGLVPGQLSPVSQIPLMMRAAIMAGHAEMIGDGMGQWDYVHINDLAMLYGIVLGKVLKGEEVPTGEKGIMFAGTGRYSWAEAASGIAVALSSLGAIKTTEVKTIELPEVVEKWFGGSRDILIAELGFASNSRTQSDVGHELGWREEKTAENFKDHFLELAKTIVATQ